MVRLENIGKRYGQTHYQKDVLRSMDRVREIGWHARLHVGVTAQDVAAAFAAEGLDAERYALFCADEVEGPDGPIMRLGVRYDQLFAMALAALFSVE